MARSFKPPYTPTFEGADTFLGNRRERRISGNTKLVRLASVDSGDNPIALRLYQTDIVTYFADGRIQIANGGWSTQTTRRYINGAAPCSVQQHKGQEFVGGKAWDGSPILVQA